MAENIQIGGASERTIEVSVKPEGVGIGDVQSYPSVTIGFSPILPDSNFVHTSGDETVSGTKTFTDSVALAPNAFFSMAGEHGVTLKNSGLYDDGDEGVAIAEFEDSSLSGGVVLRGVHEPVYFDDAANKGYVDSVSVHKSGNETIAGFKDFSDSVAVRDFLLIGTENDGEDVAPLCLRKVARNASGELVSCLEIHDNDMDNAVVITGVRDPIYSDDAASKGYVDASVSGKTRRFVATNDNGISSVDVGDTVMIDTPNISLGEYYWSAVSASEVHLALTRIEQDEVYFTTLVHGRDGWDYGESYSYPLSVYTSDLCEIFIEGSEGYVDEQMWKNAQHLMCVAYDKYGFVYHKYFDDTKSIKFCTQAYPVWDKDHFVLLVKTLEIMDVFEEGEMRKKYFVQEMSLGALLPE